MPDKWSVRDCFQSFLDVIVSPLQFNCLSQWVSLWCFQLLHQPSLSNCLWLLLWRHFEKETLSNNICRLTGGHLHAALYLLVSSILTWMSFTWSRSRSHPTLRPPEPCDQYFSLLHCNIFTLPAGGWWGSTWLLAGNQFWLDHRLQRL